MKTLKYALCFVRMVFVQSPSMGSITICVFINKPFLGSSFPFSHGLSGSYSKWQISVFIFIGVDKFSAKKILNYYKRLACHQMLSRAPHSIVYTKALCNKSSNHFITTFFIIMASSSHRPSPKAFVSWKAANTPPHTNEPKSERTHQHTLPLRIDTAAQMNCKHKNMMKIGHKNEIKTHILCVHKYYRVHIFSSEKFSLSVSFLCCTKCPIIY